MPKLPGGTLQPQELREINGKPGSNRREVHELAKRLSDQDLERLIQDLLVNRRSPERTLTRDQAVVEISFVQRLDSHIQRHLNVLAARAYQGKHPKHWLWKSHKQFFLDRLRPGERVLDVGCGAARTCSGWPSSGAR